MKALGTNSVGALRKLVALALICPSALVMAQRARTIAQSGQSPRPEYHPNQPARPADQVRSTVPPGHLQDWLNQHRNLPPAQQEQLLIRDPNFLRLNPNDQRRVLNQLRRVGTMPDQQLQRRLARAELIERLSPADKMQVNESMRRMRNLPPDREQMIRKAFQDLRGVPMEDRDMVLSSAYYRTTFSPQERIMLHDVLRVEPYEPVVPR